MSTKRFSRAMLVSLLGAVVLLGGANGSARADDDDDDVAFDTKILREIMRGIGLRRGDEGIEYRERSPLVVPPNRNLTPPVTNKSVEKTPKWPNDPDVKRRKEAKKQSKDRRSIDWDADTRPLSPTALRGNGPASSPGAQLPSTSSNPDGSNVLRPSELGYKGGLFSSLFGGPKEEYTTFTGEQPRTSLIEPPTGYRTPSTNQPYGVGKEKWVPKPIDRHEAIR